MSNFKLTKKDLKKMYELYLYSFNRTDSKSRRNFFETRYNNAQAYGYEEENKLLAGLMRIPFTGHFGEVEYKIDGISDVMSLPENMSGVNAGKILQEALLDMYEEQVELSYLAPFSYSYYRKFGYEYVFDTYNYAIKANNLPKIVLKDNGNLKRTPLATIDTELKSLYNRTTKNEFGGIIRADWWWKYSPQKHTDWQLVKYFDEKNKLRGYMFYTRTEDTFKIEEIIYESSMAFNSLLQFVKRHSSAHEIFKYESPIPKNNLEVFSDPDKVKLTVKPYMMARIINLKKFILNYPFKQPNLDINLRIKDDVIKNNDNIWNLNINNDQVKFEVSETQTADITIDIRELTQVLLGKSSITDLQILGKVQGNNKIKELNSAITSDQVIVRDYF